MQQTQVILVDEKDLPVGEMEKLEAHRKGLLHRAFSIFIVNEKGDMLLQKRAPGKYHSPELWTNACCSHPAPGEATTDAAKRRLREEMGFTCDLQEISKILYRVEFENGLIEHEYDHILLGNYGGNIHVNPEEVCDYKFLPFQQVDVLLEKDEEQFSHWFKIAYPLVKEHITILEQAGMSSHPSSESPCR